MERCGVGTIYIKDSPNKGTFVGEWRSNWRLGRYDRRGGATKGETDKLEMRGLLVQRITKGKLLSDSELKKTSVAATAQA